MKIGSGFVRILPSVRPAGAAQFRWAVWEFANRIPLADKAEASVDAYVALVTEHRRGDLRRRRALFPNFLSFETHSWSTGSYTAGLQFCQNHLVGVLEPAADWLLWVPRRSPAR